MSLHASLNQGLRRLVIWQLPRTSLAQAAPARYTLSRTVSSRPYVAERSLASKGPRSVPQASTSSTGFSAIASYNTIARRWLSIIVGIPVVVVTSFVLYKRVVLGEEPRPLNLNGSSNDAVDAERG